MMFQKRVFVTLVAAALLAGVLTATAFAKTTLTVTGHWKAGSGELNYFMDNVAAKYMELNPDVVIEYVPGSTNQSSGLAKLLTMMAGDVMPDIIHTSDGMAVDMIDNGLFATPPPQLQNKIKSFFFPPVLGGVTHNGVIMGMPTENQVTGWVGKVSMYSEAGMAPVVPKTWTEWYAQMKKLTKVDSDGVVQQYGAALWEHTSYFFSMLYSNGGTYMDGENIGLTHSSAVQTLQWWVDGVQSGLLRNFDNETVPYASFIIPSYFAKNMRADIEAKNVFTGPIPANNGVSTSYQYGWAIFVGKGSKNQEAAWKFLEWYTMQPQENRVTMAGAQMMRLGLPSAPSDLQGNPAMLTDIFYKGFITNLNTARPQLKPYPGVSERTKWLQTNNLAALAGTVSALEALTTTEELIKNQMAEYKRLKAQ